MGKSRTEENIKLRANSRRFKTSTMRMASNKMIYQNHLYITKFLAPTQLQRNTTIPKQL